MKQPSFWPSALTSEWLTHYHVVQKEGLSRSMTFKRRTRWIIENKSIPSQYSDQRCTFNILTFQSANYLVKNLPFLVEDERIFQSLKSVKLIMDAWSGITGKKLSQSFQWHTQHVVSKWFTSAFSPVHNDFKLSTVRPQVQWLHFCPIFAAVCCS